MARKRRNRPRSGPTVRWRAVRLAVRIFLIVLGAAALLLLVHIGTTRWLLEGPRLRAWINSNPEGLQLDYDEAVTPWPGRLELKNLRIRGSDENVQWMIVLERARVRYSVAALMARTFRAGGVEGTGLSFRLRQKLEPSRAREPWVMGLPPIPGFSDPPLRRPEAASQPVEDGHPWTVDVRNIAVDRFQEIWFDSYRHSGNARLDGRFVLRPGQFAHVGPAAIEFLGGQVRRGDDRVAAAITGRLTATIDAWDPRRVAGDAVWKGLSGEVKIEGRTEDLRFLDAYAGDSRRFSGGGGPISIAGTIGHGVARGDVRLDARGLEFRQPDVRLRGDARTALHIARWDLQKGPLEFRSGSVDLTDVISSGSGKARSWWGRFDLTSGRIDGGLSGRLMAKCRDARPLYALVGAPLPAWTRGLLELEDFRAEADVALGPARASVRGLEAAGGSFLIHGDYERRGRRDIGAFLIETGALAVGVRIQDGGTGLRLIKVRDWFEAQRDEVRAQRTAGSPGLAQSAGPAQ